MSDYFLLKYGISPMSWLFHDALDMLAAL